jgi:deoxyribodipyrimidine photo-lyase
MSAERQSTINIKIGRDYPQPVVDHSVQRALALDLYKNTVPQSG